MMNDRQISSLRVTSTFNQPAWHVSLSHIPDTPAFGSSADTQSFPSAIPGQLHGMQDIRPSKSLYRSRWLKLLCYRRMDSFQA